jgi:hypothetical protein
MNAAAPNAKTNPMRLNSPAGSFSAVSATAPATTNRAPITSATWNGSPRKRKAGTAESSGAAVMSVEACAAPT